MHWLTPLANPHVDLELAESGAVELRGREESAKIIAVRRLAEASAE